MSVYQRFKRWFWFRWQAWLAVRQKTRLIKEGIKLKADEAYWAEKEKVDVKKAKEQAHSKGFLNEAMKGMAGAAKAFEDNTKSGKKRKQGKEWKPPSVEQILDPFGGKR